MESGLTSHAYEDKAFPIGEGQTISQPYTVAYQSQLLKVKSGDKDLEIGTGSGYQTCVLIELGCKVFTIERQRLLFKRAELLFKKLIKYQEKFEKTTQSFMVSDEFGNNTQVSEIEFYGFELHKLENLLNTYVENEDYEKAEIIKNKIRILRIKINKL